MQSLYSIVSNMFHSLNMNYKLMSGDHKCIYYEYKIYVEKYLKMKQLFLKVKLENKKAKKDIVRLQNELDKAYEKIDAVCLQESLLEEELSQEEEDIDKYELV